MSCKPTFITLEKDPAVKLSHYPVNQVLITAAEGDDIAYSIFFPLGHGHNPVSYPQGRIHAFSNWLEAHGLGLRGIYEHGVLFRIHG